MKRLRRQLARQLRRLAARLDPKDTARLQASVNTGTRAKVTLTIPNWTGSKTELINTIRQDWPKR